MGNLPKAGISTRRYGGRSQFSEICQSTVMTCLPRSRTPLGLLIVAVSRSPGFRYSCRRLCDFTNRFQSLRGTGVTGREKDLEVGSTTPMFDDDLYSARNLRDPYPAYRQLRDLGPAVWMPKRRMWAISRFDDVRIALRRPTFS
jgi:hypothetical protein